MVTDVEVVLWEMDVDVRCGQGCTENENGD